MFKLSDITVAILAGGLGTRLRSKIPNKQKVLAKVGKYPFLEYLLNKLDKDGFRNVVICTGYLGRQVQERFGKTFKNLSLYYSQEKSKLDTAGAVRLALALLKSDDILVVNGDSFFDTDLNEFYKFHLKKKAKGTILLTQVSNITGFGKIEVNEKGRILVFQEKKKSDEAGLINGGIYLFKRSLLFEIPEKRSVSFEKELFPHWIGKNFYGFEGKGKFIDIGTPQSYSRAEEFFEKKRFVLLDRDGTLVVHRQYLSHPDQIELTPGAAEALREFKKLGLGVVVITNQSGIGRGYFDLKTLEKIHQRLTSLLAQEGIVLDDIYFCPHTPEDNCLCRKPKVGLIKEAIKKHNFDPKLSFVIGDNESDMELGKNIGATTILVRTGYGLKVAEKKYINPDYVTNDLLDTSKIIKKLI